MVDAQTFMYFALGVGFLILIFFLCLAMVHVIRILKDVADASDSVKDAAEKMNESVAKIADQVTVTTDQISEYLVKPLSALQFLTSRFAPFLDMLRKKGEEFKDAVDGDEPEEKPRPTHKKKRRFGRK